MRSSFRLLAATFTPFRNDGSVNLVAIEAYAQWLAREGIQGVFVNGTTGEGASLTFDERLATARRWLEVARGLGLEVLVQVGASSLEESRQLARAAQKERAAGLAWLPPSYYKPQTLADLVACCQQVAGAAPDLPFYYYHIPSRTGVAIPVADLLREAPAVVPRLAGVKFSHSDFQDLLRCMELGRFDILFGLDEMLLPALAVGVRGAVGTTYNFAAALYRRLLQAFQDGDWEAARQEQSQANALIACLNRYGFLPAAKAVMRWVGVDCGPVRLPLRSLTRPQEEQLFGELKTLGFPERFVHS